MSERERERERYDNNDDCDDVFINSVQGQGKLMKICYVEAMMMMVMMMMTVNILYTTVMMIKMRVVDSTMVESCWLQ